MSAPQNETNQYFYPDNQHKMFVPVQPVPVMAGTPGVAQQPAPIVVYQTQPNIQQPQVIVVKEQPRKRQSSGRCCYCYGPKQSPCGCCDSDKEYCCIIVVFAYIVMSLHYIATCLCIILMCRNLSRGGIC